MNPRRHNPLPDRGFSLLEMLVYLAVIGVTLVAATSLTLEFVLANSKAMAYQETQRNVRYALDRVAIEVREAAAINTGDSVFGSDPGRLSLATDFPATDPTVFTVSGGQLFIQQGAGPVLPLTAPTVQFTEFSVDNLSSSGFARVVRLHAAARHVSDYQAFAVSSVMETTAAVRKAEGFSN